MLDTSRILDVASRGVTLAAPLVLLAIAASSSEAQRTAMVQLEPVVSIGAPTDPAGFGVVVEVANRSSGGYLVSSETFPGEVFLYGADGRFIRSIGREGDGPGEFRGQVLIEVDAEDSVHIVDSRGRYSIFSPALDHVSTVRLGGRVFSFALGRTGNLFAASPVFPTEPGATMLAMQIYRADGTSLRRFGTSGGGREDPMGIMRYVAVDSEGAMWSAHPSRLKIERWDEEGESIAVFERESEWLSGEPLPTRLDINSVKPPSQVTGLSVGDDGNLWLFVAVADAEWRPGRADTPSAVFDTMLLAIDRSSGDVIAELRLDEIARAVSGSLLHYFEEDSTGERVIKILRATLVH